MPKKVRTAEALNCRSVYSVPFEVAFTSIGTQVNGSFPSYSTTTSWAKN